MSTPLVSVVIPTYNQPELLLETLASVFAQTLDDFEVVVINDGSTDDTAHQLRRARDRYGGRLRVVTQSNAGIGAARNRGLDEARGRYVALLDHDDLWMPGKLATQVAFMEAHPACVGASVPWAMSDSRDRCAFDLEAVRGANGVVRRPLWELARGQLWVLTSTLMIDRARADGLRYATRRRCIEDVPFYLGLFGRGAVAIAGDALLAVRRLHEGNYSTDPTFYEDGIQLLREMDRAGRFADLRGQARKDMLSYLARIGRSAAVLQLSAGWRRQALGRYLGEWAHQARLGRFKFLTMFPFMTLLPAASVRRRWPVEPR
jgi:glycosyltransferase involved in cell wall biosynthesis